MVGFWIVEAWLTRWGIERVQVCFTCADLSHPSLVQRLPVVDYEVKNRVMVRSGLGQG